MLAKAESTIRHTQQFFEPAETNLAVSKQLQQQGVFDAVPVPSIERYFFEHLSASPELSGLYYGDKDGNFVFVSRSDDVEQAQFRTKVITRERKLSGASLVYRNSEFKKISARYDEDDSYDPRERPWYNAAVKKGGTTWTEPYIFYSSREPGITVATPVHLGNGAVEGVLGIDMEIASISRFLADLEIGQSGAAIVLSANGDVIAHSDPTKLKMPKQGGYTRFELGERTYDTVFSPVEFGGLDWIVAIYVPEDEILGDILSNRYRNIALAISLTLFSIVLGWLISRRLTLPLEKVSQFADQIARGETVNVQALPGTFAEVEQVSTAFRRMTQWLDGYQAQNDEMHQKLVSWSRELEVRVEERTSALQSSNALLRTEIEERTEAERKLAIEVVQHRETSRELDWALAEANEASQAKSRFLSSMSHELRTPLNSIIGFGQMLDGRVGNLTEVQKTEYAGFILESGERLLSLINQVLDLAGIEAGKTLLSLEAMDPKAIVRRVIAEAGVLADARKITLIDDTVDTDLPEISADVHTTAKAAKYACSQTLDRRRSGSRSPIPVVGFQRVGTVKFLKPSTGWAQRQPISLEAALGWRSPKSMSRKWAAK